MKSCSVIIIDQQEERGKAIFKVWQDKFDLHEYDLEWFGYFNFEEGLRKYVQDEKKWVEASSYPDRVTIRLKHMGEGFKNMPEGSLQIRYSGAKDGATNDIESREWGIHDQLLSNGKNVKEVFSSKVIKAILDYTFGFSKDVPTIFRAKSYRGDLEDQLKKGHKSIQKSNFEGLAKFGEGVFAPSQLKSIKGLVIWSGLNPTFKSRALDLCKHFDPELSIEEGNLKVISKLTELDEITTELEQIDFAIINADAPWEPIGNYTAFKGINCLVDLRRRKFRGLAFLGSLVPLAILQHYDLPEFKIINTNYCYLWDLSSELVPSPYPTQNLKSKELTERFEAIKNRQLKDLEILRTIGETRMSSNRFEDMRLHILSVEGQLSSIRHDFKKRAQSCRNRIEMLSLVKEKFEDISYIIAPSMQPVLDKMYRVLIEKIKAADLKIQWINSFLKLKSDISALLPKDSIEYEEPTPELTGIMKIEKEWGVLLIEDHIETANDIKNMLGKHGIEVVHHQNVISALGELDSDLSVGAKINEAGKINFLTVAIVDIRLEDEHNRWNLLQGYDFFRLAMTKNNFLSFVALTNKEGYILRSAQSRHRVFINWYSKEMLLSEGTREMLIEGILKIGNETYDALCNIPQSAIWHRAVKRKHSYPLKYYYRLFRQDPDYFKLNRAINEVTEKLVEHALTLFDEGSNPNLTRQVKEYIGSLEFLTWTLSSKLEEFKKSAKQFYAKLTARRVAIKLSSLLQADNQRYFTSEDIFYLLTRFTIQNDADFYDHSLFNHQLGISANVKKMTEDILVEERNFLHRS